MQKLKPVHQSSRLADKFIIRLPPGMRHHIAVKAGVNRRSMNSEIILRLQRSFHQSFVLENSDLPTASSELSSHELALLLHFRQLAHPRQQALVSLIAPASNVYETGTVEA